MYSSVYQGKITHLYLPISVDTNSWSVLMSGIQIIVHTYVTLEHGVKLSLRKKRLRSQDDPA